MMSNFALYFALHLEVFSQFSYISAILYIITQTHRLASVAPSVIQEKPYQSSRIIVRIKCPTHSRFVGVPRLGTATPKK